MALFHRANVITGPLLNNSYRKLSKNVVKVKVNDLIGRNNLRGPQKNAKFLGKCGTGTFQESKCFMTFDKMLRDSKSQASRSILVQVQSANSCNELFAHCSKFGKILSMHHYKLQHNQNFILVEYEKLGSVYQVLTEAGFLEDDVVIPKTSTLWFSNLRGHLLIGSEKGTDLLSVIDGCEPVTIESIISSLQAASSISNQMEIIYKKLKLTDLEKRLRFYITSQIEQCFSKIYPDTIVYPFGSSVNGFGKKKCDLDLVITVSKTYKKHARLMFHSRPIKLSHREAQKDFLMSIANNMHHCLPGVTSIRKVLDARVPIVKFNHLFTDIDCDLSLTNMSAVYMSELLYIFGEIDNRVRPMVFTIKLWARQQKLTHNSPGRWITNFSLSLLVLFYLQEEKVLPTLNELKLFASHEDIRCTSTAIDCTFLRDVTKLPSNKKGQTNSKTLEQLLYGFFDYYSKFSYESQAISLRHGAPVQKADSSPLYICNPIETHLNVSKNVNHSELQRFVMYLQNAMILLQNEGTKDHWGILPLMIKDIPLRKFKISLTSVANDITDSVVQNDELLTNNSNHKVIKQR